MTNKKFYDKHNNDQKMIRICIDQVVEIEEFSFCGKIQYGQNYRDRPKV